MHNATARVEMLVRTRRSDEGCCGCIGGRCSLLFREREESLENVWMCGYICIGDLSLLNLWKKVCIVSRYYRFYNKSGKMLIKKKNEK